MDASSTREALRGISDEDLWALVARGDHAAFNELHDRFAAPIRIVLEAWLEDASAVEDLTAETLARAWERRTRWRPRKVKAFLQSTALHLARDQGRSEAARAERERTWCESIRRDLPSCEQLLDLRFLRATLLKAIKKLPRQRRRAFVLTCCHGYSYGEAADRMRISARTVEHHVSGAKADLRQNLRMLVVDGGALSSGDAMRTG